MAFLVDTMVVSEPTKTKPNANVLSWLASHDLHDQFVSVLSLGEIYYGVRRLPEGARRERLTRWLHRDIAATFRGRILPVSASVALAWARLRTKTRNTPSPVDTLIAATARLHDLTLVTRNVRHFAPLGVKVIDPWTWA